MLGRSRRVRPTRARQAGVLVPAFALWLAVAALCCFIIVGTANRASQRAAAQSAADATALAGAADGRDTAAVIAAANEAKILSYVSDGRVVTVRVERNGVAAMARAEKQIRPALSG